MWNQEIDNDKQPAAGGTEVKRGSPGIPFVPRESPWGGDWTYSETEQKLNAMRGRIRSGWSSARLTKEGLTRKEESKGSRRDRQG